MRTVTALLLVFVMSIPVRANPCNVAPAAFARLAPWEKALLRAADECDFYKSREEPKGSNRGPRVDAYLKACGLNPGYAWCAAFVYWSFVQAGSKPPISGPAAVMSWYAWAKKTGSLLARPKRGCLFAYTKTGSTHIGFVTRVSADGQTFETIEGNTNDDGSREGYEVARRTRSVKSANGLVFIDTAGL